MGQRAGRADLPQGQEHEDAYLQRLEAEGNTVAKIDLAPDYDWERAARETEEAMRAGVDVVYQAALVGEGWRGQADFLMRVDTPSDLGPWSYEALDTKLARHAKPAYILQLCFYSERVGAIQGRAPERIHVLLGNLTQESFRPEEFGAYYRRVCRRLEEFVADPPETKPYPCDHCGICEFKPLCDEYWDLVDHPSRVAYIQRRQIDRSRRGDHNARGPRHRARGARPHRDRRRHLREAPQPGQASASSALHGRGQLRHPPAAGRRRLRAPAEPSRGDLFFDFEGNPFWDHEGGLEYLWGILATDGGSSRWSRRRATRSARRSRTSSTSCTSASPQTQRCTSTTTRATRSRRSGG